MKKQVFLCDILNHKRLLVAAEITNLYANLQRNALGVATFTGFSQVAQDHDVKLFIRRGIEIGKKHAKLFGEKLEESNPPVPTTWSSEITNSTAHTFSDKMMMFYTSSLISLSIGYYGISTSQSPRVDIGVMYNRLLLEIQLYSENGVNIMIKKWLEQLQWLSLEMS
ncbi:DUF3231 family protein [Halalkalibacter sp. AB-rgal2]|uniref:DUF3231 family protein n=1 Tax=Halalkalibacter sp. AB-rgal2 TaxID=3242695 RepID=UPI00359EB1C6